MLIKAWLIKTNDYIVVNALKAYGVMPDEALRVAIDELLVLLDKLWLISKSWIAPVDRLVTCLF